MELFELIGGLISCESPYILIIIFGYYFSYLKVLEKDSLEPLSKTVIMVTLPVYYFLLIGKTNSLTNLQNYYIIIISDLIKTSISFIISFIFVFRYKMDSRYKYSWIAINTFQDIRLLSQSISNTFCYHIKYKSLEENEFCQKATNYSCIHLFFNQILLWYLMFNLIRRDKQYNVAISKVWEEVALKNLEKPETNKDLTIKENEKENERERENENGKDNEREKGDLILEFQAHEIRENNEVYATPSFSKKVRDYYQRKINKVEKNKYINLIYTFLQPPIVAIFSGFILGFIPSLQAWWFDTKSAVFMFEDTFNTIGNSHLVCSFLILGINLYMKEKDLYSVRFTRLEYMIHLLIKCIILPFIGLIFLLIANLFFNNRALLFSAYIQWFLPTSQDILMICQSKNVAAYSVSICILIQYCYLTFINNFVVIPLVIKILG